MARADVEAVAGAAMAWHHARLRRIAIAKRVPVDWRHPQHMAASHVLAEARKAEAKALAGLRKACREADPQSRVIDVEAREPLANRWLTHGLPRPLHGRA